MSSTVLRVKRRLEDNPQDALVLVCKRIKTDADAGISPSLFVFRGTVENQEDNHVKSIYSTSEKKLKTPRNVDDIIQKIRQERKEVSSESRYEVVNCSRGLKEDEADKGHYDLVDLQPRESTEEEQCQYAYDLYTAAKKDFDISMLEDLVYISNVETELIFSSYRDNGLRTSSCSSEHESDDSNDENNWRNEYPDSEHSSIGSEDMVRAVENCRLEDDLSSDADEDKIYDEPSDLFNEDVKRYGEAYAKYKAKVLAEQPELANSSLVHCVVKDMDEESVDGYKGDSDDDGFYYGQEEDTDHFKDQYKEDSDSELYDPD
ncbi:probable RNA polymerase II nuclear localization protein SLC7A6OS [Plutella xylostella]|uniref:probable RNA polymerase II nuclear localization protein SLC7A6OS n=1 Tax=Plutella xylostella TaxID=51655 RepID=UPI002032BF91|nr:probable RNA polymerase II nuclear localization protein SLC7A6OS [Plutella xylostella]